MSEEIQPYQAVLLDIEGTITPIAFVYDTLFPFARENAARFLHEHWDEHEVQTDVTNLRELSVDLAVTDPEVVPIPPDSAVTRGGLQKAVREFVHYLMHKDAKATALKSLQGKIWRDGYEQLQIHGELYDDAIRALARWSSREIVIGIYSSGSIAAQQLLFEHSIEGDLRPFVGFWFDTTTGPKREPQSYEKIADAMGVTPSSVLFATDVVAEAQAARRAGMQVVIMDRLGNEKQPPHPFVVEEGFEMI